MTALLSASSAWQVGPFLGCSFLPHTCHTFYVQRDVFLVDLWCHYKIVVGFKAAPRFTKCWQSAVASSLPHSETMQLKDLGTAHCSSRTVWCFTAMCSRKQTVVQCCGCFNVKQTNGTGVFIWQQLTHQVGLSLRFNQKHRWTLLIHSDLKMLDIKSTKIPQTSCTLCWLIVLFNAQCLLKNKPPPPKWVCHPQKDLAPKSESFFCHSSNAAAHVLYFILVFCVIETTSHVVSASVKSVLDPSPQTGLLTQPSSCDPLLATGCPACLST